MSVSVTIFCFTLGNTTVITQTLKPITVAGSLAHADSRHNVITGVHSVTSEYLYKVRHIDVIGVWKPGDQGANLTIFGGVHGAAYGYLDLNQRYFYLNPA